MRILLKQSIPMSGKFLRETRVSGMDIFTDKKSKKNCLKNKNFPLEDIFIHFLWLTVYVEKYGRKESNGMKKLFNIIVPQSRKWFQVSVGEKKGEKKGFYASSIK